MNELYESGFRPGKLESENITPTALSSTDGKLLYYAFTPKDALTLSADITHEAKNKIQALCAKYPDKIEEWKNLTLEGFRSKLIELGEIKE